MKIMSIVAFVSLFSLAASDNAVQIEEIVKHKMRLTKPNPMRMCVKFHQFYMWVNFFFYDLKSYIYDDVVLLWSNVSLSIDRENVPRTFQICDTSIIYTGIQSASQTISELLIEMMSVAAATSAEKAYTAVFKYISPILDPCLLGSYVVV